MLSLEVESLNPELAKRLKREAGIGEKGSLALTLTPGKVHQQQAVIRARDARVEALNHNQHRLRRGAVV